MAIKSILVPTDLSAISLRALDYAVRMAKPLRAELTLLYVIEPIAYASPVEMYAGAASQLGDLITIQRRHARETMASLQAKYGKKGVKLRSLIREGLAHQEIVDVAQKLDVDMIVLATHGRTGLSHLVMGSVAERIVRLAPCAVLTLRGALLEATARSAKSKKKASARRKK